jgi:hypothetical protein
LADRRECVDGKIAWKYHSKRPMLASVTTTSADLVFTGELTGDFVVLNARDGNAVPLQYRWPCNGRRHYLCSCWQAVRWSDVWRRHQVLEDSTSIIDSDYFLITLGGGSTRPFWPFP